MIMIISKGKNVKIKFDHYNLLGCRNLILDDDNNNNSKLNKFIYFSKVNEFYVHRSINNKVSNVLYNFRFRLFYRE